MALQSPRRFGRAPTARTCASGGASTAPQRRASAPVRPRVVRAAAGDDEPAPPPAPGTPDDDLWIERELRRRAKKRAAADAGAGPTVVAPAVAKARQTAAGGGTAMDAIEVGYRRFLGAFFTLILLEGLALGGAGFLPDEADAWVAGVLYPTFSPTVGLFLVASSIYGVWKSKQGDGGGGLS